MKDANTYYLDKHLQAVEATERLETAVKQERESYINSKIKNLTRGEFSDLLTDPYSGNENSLPFIRLFSSFYEAQSEIKESLVGPHIAFSIKFTDYIRYRLGEEWDYTEQESFKNHWLDENLGG